MIKQRVIRLFPFLVRLRKAQRKLFFYLKMRLDDSRYAAKKSAEALPYCAYEAETNLINLNTGCDLKYQENKVFNLRLAAEPINGLVIRPWETFSFWQLVRKAKRAQFKHGLSVEYGELVPVKGGGLCHLSNFLYWMFLHTPLTIAERHPHRVKDFPSPDADDLDGVDATVSEGWLDLKLENNTDMTFQIVLTFSADQLHGRILTDRPMRYRFEVVNRDKTFFKKGEKLFEQVCVYRQRYDALSGLFCSKERLYTDVFEIGYPVTEEYDLQEAGAY